MMSQSYATLRPAIAAAVLLTTLSATAAEESPRPSEERAPEREAELTTPPVPVRASADRIALEPALLMPFRDVLRQRSLAAELANLDERLELRLAGPDRLEGSRLRTRDETGAHNDFRLEHSGNLLRIPLQR